MRRFLTILGVEKSQVFPCIERFYPALKRSQTEFLKNTRHFCRKIGHKTPVFFAQFRRFSVKMSQNQNQAQTAQEPRKKSK